MATNDFLPFGIGAGANVMAQADYATLAARLAGFSAGVAKSPELNKVWRQSSLIAAMIAQFTAEKSGQDVLDDGDVPGLVQKFVSALVALPDFPKVYSINALPTKDIGPIIVAECSEVWNWVSTQYFTGYRSPLCGRPLDGHTMTPLPSEVDGVGGILNKVKYAGLWGYAQENNLVVTQAVWTANIGAHYFVDVDANNFRVPDLRNMLRRYTGTDADTANARTLGSRQIDAIQNITGDAPFIFTTGGATNATGAFSWKYLRSSGYASGTAPNAYDYLQFDASKVARTSTETRGKNTAINPRIHV